ncbi:hypothetical protein LTR40_011982, partial [Exophiala xenobiotica]
CRFSTPTPTPTDSWASYFDSWKSEDLEVPTSGYEPMIVDDELHPDSMNVKFNLDFDLGWELDIPDSYSPLPPRLPSLPSTKLNGRQGLPRRHDVDGRVAGLPQFQAPAARNGQGQGGLRGGGHPGQSGLGGLGGLGGQDHYASR